MGTYTTPFNYRRGRSLAPEVVLFPGPRTVAAPGSGSLSDLYGYAWALALDRKAGALIMWQALDAAGNPLALGADPTGGAWAVRAAPALAHDPKSVRHVSAAFDQAARVAVAYEVGGSVYVLQWDPGVGNYVMRGPWPGVDPVLVSDAPAAAYVPGSQLRLFHLDPDRAQMIERVQGELYDIPHTVAMLPGPHVLDQGYTAPLTVQIVAAPLDALEGPPAAIVSDLYPYRSQDSLGAAQAQPVASGDYYPVVIIKTLPQDSLGAAQAQPVALGDYYPVVIIETLPQDALGTVQAQPVASGDYPQGVTVVDLTGAGYASPDTLGTAQAAPISGGSYDLA